MEFLQFVLSFEFFPTEIEDFFVFVCCYNLFESVFPQVGWRSLVGFTEFVCKSGWSYSLFTEDLGYFFLLIFWNFELPSIDFLTIDRETVADRSVIR